MNRFSRLIVLLSIPLLIALGLHWRSNPVSAANQPNIATQDETAEAPGIKAKGRDIIVIDGDTIMIAGQVFDIAGMDAPELGQQCRHNDSFQDCGMSSALQLRKYFAMAPFDVQCWPGDQPHTAKSGGFPTVECGIGERDVAAAMISDGEALPIKGYSHSYDSLSAEADNANIGIHGSDMVLPTDWRKGKRLDGEAGKCLFVSDSSGNYISPLDPRFETSESTDTQNICSDEEARTMELNYRAPAP